MRFPMLISPLPGANPRLPEHKIGVFVLICPSEPPFSALSSTKSGFLCAFGVWNRRFRAFRAQNRGFCALLAFGTPIFWLFEHKIGVFVRFWGPGPPFSGVSSTKSGFLCAFGLRDRHFLAFRAQIRGFCALLPAGRAERAGRAEQAGRAERAERTRRAERAGVLSSQKRGWPKWSPS